MMNPAEVQATSRSSAQPPVVMAARAKTRTAAKAAPKSRATSGPQGSVVAHGARAPRVSDAVWEEQWIVHRIRRRRRLLRNVVDDSYASAFRS